MPNILHRNNVGILIHGFCEHRDVRSKFPMNLLLKVFKSQVIFLTYDRRPEREVKLSWYHGLDE